MRNYTCVNEHISNTINFRRLGKGLEQTIEVRAEDQEKASILLIKMGLINYRLNHSEFNTSIFTIKATIN